MAKVIKKKIKEDKLVSTTTKLALFFEENWKKIAGIAGAIIIVIAAIIAFYGYTNSKNAKASMILSEAMKLYDTAETAMGKDGNIPTTLNKYETAKAKFQEVVQYGGNSSIISEATYFSARCSYQAGKYNEAISDYEKFMKKYPKNPNAIAARDGIAKSNVQMGDNESLRKAIQYYDELSKYPESYITIDAFMNKGMCYEKLGENDQALAAYKVIVDRFKVKVDAEIQSNSKIIVEKAKDVIKKYEELLGSSASDANFKSLLEKAQSLEKGKQEQGFETLLAYDKVILSRNEYWQQQAVTASDSNKIKEAEKALREYETQSLDMIRSVGMGQKYIAQGDWDTALRYYGRIIDFNFLPAREMYEKAQSNIDLINFAKQGSKPQA
jgi:tetratricopeptide (TPR) repeat protein